MKRFFKGMLLATIAIFTIVTTVNAQKDNKEGVNPLVGIWQFNGAAYDNTKGEFRLVKQPIFKIIKEDNTYLAIYGRVSTLPETNIAETNVIISQEGRYNIINDSTYTEQIDKHYMNKSMQGTTSILKYKFLDPEKTSLYITFTNGNIPQPVSEIWYRVQPMQK